MCWKFIRQKIQKAKKEHRCNLCGLPIKVNEKYLCRVGVFEFKMVSIQMHLPCEEITEDWDDNDWENFDEWNVRQELENRKKGGK